jgi:hypothetical protein
VCIMHVDLMWIVVERTRINGEIAHGMNNRYLNVTIGLGDSHQRVGKQKMHSTAEIRHFEQAFKTLTGHSRNTF